jgi:phage major head subunit gpT-like protein
MHMRAAGAAQRRWEEDLINDAKKNGKTNLCFDGIPYYNASHPQGLNGQNGTFGNLFTSTALTVANITTRFQYMTQIQDANGRKMGIRPNVLEYGPGDLGNVRVALEAELIGIAVSGSPGGAASQSNVQVRGLLKPVLNPELENGVWYLHDTRIIKPFILQQETSPTGLEMRFNPEDPHVWDFNEFLFGARATGAGGYTLPHLSARMEE